MSASAPTLLRSAQGLGGTWRRSLLIAANGLEDRTTSVTWVQGPRLYVDLRLPAPGTGATVDGFAGELGFTEEHFVWSRMVEVRPPSAAEDAASLHIPGDADADTLVERGLHESYIEHWHRSGREADHCAAALLSDPVTGEVAIVVRADDVLGFATAPSGSTGVIGIGSLARGHLLAASTPDLIGPFHLRLQGPTLTTTFGAGGAVRNWQVLRLEGSAHDLSGRGHQ